MVVMQRRAFPDVPTPITLCDIEADWFRSGNIGDDLMTNSILTDGSAEAAIAGLAISQISFAGEKDRSLRATSRTSNDAVVCRNQAGVCCGKCQAILRRLEHPNGG